MTLDARLIECEPAEHRSGTGLAFGAPQQRLADPEVEPLAERQRVATGAARDDAARRRVGARHGAEV